MGALHLHWVHHQARLHALHPAAVVYPGLLRPRGVAQARPQPRLDFLRPAGSAYQATLGPLHLQPPPHVLQPAVVVHPAPCRPGCVAPLRPPHLHFLRPAGAARLVPRVPSLRSQALHPAVAGRRREGAVHPERHRLAYLALWYYHHRVELSLASADDARDRVADEELAVPQFRAPWRVAGALGHAHVLQPQRRLLAADSYLRLAQPPNYLHLQRLKDLPSLPLLSVCRELKSSVRGCVAGEEPFRPLILAP